VLDDLAQFVPLVFLSGISGALFVLDQAVAVAAILLSVSLAVAFIPAPMLYYLLFSKSKKVDDGKRRPFFLQAFWIFMSLGYRIITAKSEGCHFQLFCDSGFPWDLLISPSI